MKCEKHAWGFHAEMLDGTIVRWCEKCGGLQTYIKPNSDLRLDHTGFTQYAPSEVILPEVASGGEFDGLYDEGAMPECLPTLRVSAGWNRTPFAKPWTPDDDGELAARPEMPEATPAMKQEFWEAYADLRKLSGINTDDDCCGK